MMCPSCGKGKMRSHLHHCDECGDDYIGEVAAKHIDRIAKDFCMIRLEVLRKAEQERDEAISVMNEMLTVIDDARKIGNITGPVEVCIRAREIIFKNKSVV